MVYLYPDRVAGHVYSLPVDQRVPQYARRGPPLTRVGERSDKRII